VTISPRIVTAWRSNREHVLIRLQAAGANAQDAQEALQRARTSAAAAFPAGIGLWEAVRLPDDSAVLPVNFCDSEELLRALLDHLARSLETDGVQGVLREFRSEWSVLHDPLVDTPALTAVLSLRLKAGAKGAATTRDLTRDDVAPSALASQVEHALAWTNVAGGDHYLEYGGLSLRLAEHARRAALRTALTSSPGTSPHPAIAIECVNWPDRARRAAFTWNGRVLLSEAAKDMPESWTEILAAQVHMLRSNADRVSFGVILRSGAAPYTMEGALSVGFQGQLRPAVNANATVLTRALDDRRLPDAFGVQLLGPRFGPIPESGSADWRIDTLPGGAHLLVHSRPAAWFAHPSPDPAEHEAARAVWRSLLLSGKEEAAMRLARFGRPPPGSADRGPAGS
jgi:hypothetical protein